MKSKKCNKCGEVKSHEEFYKNKNRNNSLFSSCKECYLKAKKEYKLNNKEKIKAQNKIYKEKNKASILEKARIYNATRKEEQKKYRKENKERLKLLHKKWREANKDSLNQKMYLYRNKNKEKFKMIAKKYRQSEKGKESSYRKLMKRRSQKHKITFHVHERRAILERDKYICQNCRIKVHDRRINWNTPDKAHIDHVMPLLLGGTSEPKNLQTLCRTCNLRKGYKGNEQLALF